MKDRVLHLVKRIAPEMVWLVGFLALFSCVYFNAIFIDFAQNDDFSYFLYEDRSHQKHHPQYNFFLIVGRPLYNLFMWPFAYFIDELGDFKYLRFIAVIGMSLFSFLIFNILKTLNDEKLKAFLLAAMIGCLPGFQVSIAWVTMLPFFLAAIFAVISGTLAVKFFTLKKPVYVLIFSVALLFTSLNIYQPWSMLFVLPVSLWLWNRKGLEPATLKPTALVILTFLATILGYFVVQKLLMHVIYFNYEHLRALHESLGDFRFALHDSIYDFITQNISKLHSGLRNLLFPVVYPQSLYTQITPFFLYLWLCLYISAITFLQGKMKAVLLVLIQLLTLIPIIMAAGAHMGFRVTLPFMVVFALFSILCIDGIISKYRNSRTGLAVVSVLMVLFGCSAYMNTKFNAMHNNRELDRVTAAIDCAHKSGSKIVRLFPLTDSQRLTGNQTIGDLEFFHLNTINPNNSFLMFRAAAGYWKNKNTEIRRIHYCREDVEADLKIIHQYDWDDTCAFDGVLNWDMNNTKEQNCPR